MSDVAAFIRARLDEDHAAALAALPPNPGIEHGRYLRWRQTGEVLGDDSGCVISYSVSRRALGHIARHDPARVLAQVAAMRAIVEEHDSREVASLERDTWAQSYIVCRRCRVGERQVVAPCPTLRHLAAIWASHPDYDPAWSPDGE